jgi:hypothetical protein
MNPNAKPFSFNPTATTWTPPAPPAAAIAPGLSSTPTPQVEEKVVSVEEVVAKTEDLTVSQEKEDVVEDEDALDETDPLWIATLKVSKGDREAALRLLDDPDALMAYPEIVAIMDASGPVSDEEDEEEETATEDWETTQDQEVGKKSASPEDTESGESTDTPALEAYQPQKPGKKVVVENDEEEEVEDDPREHMNIVFIGHVDAGKSTLSGSILYLMGKVDVRTIERFEKEAKNRNRESWFLAFIMDTSEEERAKGKTVEV